MRVAAIYTPSQLMTHYTVPASPAKLASPLPAMGKFLRVPSAASHREINKMQPPLYANGANRALSLVAAWYRLQLGAIRSHQVL